MKHMTIERAWAVGYCSTGDETGVDAQGAETGVAERLRKLGIEVYCPRFEKPVRRRQWHNRKRETVVKALLPAS